MDHVAVDVDFTKVVFNNDNFFPWFCVKMWFKRVVFPDPRKPVRMVIGIRSSLMTMVLLVFSCSCDDDTQSNFLLPVLGALLNLLLCSEEEEEEEDW